MNHLRAELASALERRQAEARPLHVFFRDDDVDEDEASLRRLLALFLRRAAPVNLGVIPGRLTEAAVSLLARHGRDFPRSIELNQHGWLHLNHEREGRNCEFGASRTYAEQLRRSGAGEGPHNGGFRAGLVSGLHPALESLHCEDLSRAR
jgi:hypothetical protein